MKRRGLRGEARSLRLSSGLNISKRPATAGRPARSYPGLMVVAWDIRRYLRHPTMTAAINAHVRRHDAYHERFGFEDGIFFRRMIDAPELIDFVPFVFRRWARRINSRDTLDLDAGHPRVGLLHVGIVQHADYFTFYASVDHLHTDGMSAGLIYFDIHLMYHHLSTTAGQTRPITNPQVRSYRDYAARQHDKLSDLTRPLPRPRDGSISRRTPTGTGRASRCRLATRRAATEVRFVTVELRNGVERRRSTQLAALPAPVHWRRLGVRSSRRA